MKIQATSYTFNAGAKTISFSGVVPASLESILHVANVTTGALLFQPQAGPLFTGTWSSPVLTLAASTTGMTNTDRLLIFLEDGAATQPVSDGGGSLTVDGPVTDAQLRAAAVPVSGPLTDGQLRASAVPVSAAALPLPTGAATETTLAALNTKIPAAPATEGGNLAGINAKLPTLDSGRVPVVLPPGGGGLTDAELRASAVAVSAASLPLPTGAATEATLATMNGKLPSPGQALMAASQPVALASDQTPIPTLEAATVITGAAAQTAVVNNILPATSGATATDTANFRSATVQVVSTGTAGTFIFEQSNDGTNFVALPVFNAVLVTGVPITAAITATVSQIIYTFPVRARFTRLRIASTITGGSIQAFTRLSSDPWTAAAQLVASNTAANMAATVSGTVTANIGTGTVAAVTAVTAANLALPGIITDVASAALASTTTTAAFTPTFGISYTVNIPVTAATGTTPTLDVAVEESDDSGTNWFKVYDFPRITATGMYRSPLIRAVGNRVRYVQTVGGGTPSFTRAINRLQNSSSAEAVRQLIDRSIVLTTLNSTTPNLDTRDAGNRAQLVVNVGAITTTAPALQMEGSDDNGASWYAIGTPLTAVASSTVQATVTDINAALMRVRVSTAGAGVTAGYVLLKAHD
jgi:hypothetical protein